MKSKKIITLIIVVLLIIAVAVASIVLAGTEVTHQGIEEKDRTSVVLVPEQTEDGLYTGKVDVYLEMDDGMLLDDEDKNEENENVIIKDAASVASFQIGLNINATTTEDITSKIKFDYDSRLKENETNKKQYGVELARKTQAPITTTQTAEDGTQTTSTIGEKINLYFVGTQELNDVNSSEPLKVGTITIDKKAFGDNAIVSISPEGTDEEGNVVTTAASIGHNPTEITVDQTEDRVELILNKKNQSQEVDLGTGDEEEPGTGDEEEPGTGDEEDPGTGDEEEPGIGEVNGSGNNENMGAGSENNGVNNNSTQTPSEINSEVTDNSKTDKGNSSFVDKLIPKIKTGANHSLVLIIIPIVVLIIAAFGIIYLKSRIKSKNSKH